MIKVGKYNRENTDADFDSDLVVEGVVFEILSLNTLLKVFKKSSIVNLMTEALKPLLLLLNRYRSRRLYSIMIVFADFDHDLKHLGVVLEILSLTTLLQIF